MIKCCMSVISFCRKWKALIYEEQVMAGWSADENDHNTRCWMCKHPFSPVLTIELSVPQRDMDGGDGTGHEPKSKHERDTPHASNDHLSPPNTPNSERKASSFSGESTQSS